MESEKIIGSLEMLARTWKHMARQDRERLEEGKHHGFVDGEVVVTDQPMSDKTRGYLLASVDLAESFVNQLNIVIERAKEPQ